MARFRLLGVCFCALFAPVLWSQEQPDPLPSEGARLGYALGDVVMENGLVASFNRFVTREDFAQVTLRSIETNVDSSWTWDQDGFLVNQLGHPYQGSFYFSAARAQGLSFYPAVFVAMMGSASWELFGETELPSKNDFMATTLGGSALGEMFHRLYLEAAASKLPFAFLLSPLDGLAHSPTRERASALAISAALGPSALFGSERAAFPAGLRGEVNVEYGDPYAADARIPYESFDQTWVFGISPDSYLFGFLSDGFLRSWVLRGEPQRQTSAGFSLHYDLLLEPDLTYSDNALGLSVKQKRLYSGGTVLRLAEHLSWIALGASDNSILRVEHEENPPEEESRDYDLGTGVGVKLAIVLRHPELGNLSATFCHSALWIFEDSAPEDGFTGTVSVDFARLSYEHEITQRWLAGLSADIYRKQALYDGYSVPSSEKAALGAYVRLALL